MIPGTVINLSGKAYLLPPLNFRSFKLHKEFLGAAISGIFDKSSTMDSMEKLAEVVHSALVRNYPDLSLETVEDGLDFGNVQGVFQALMTTSGLVDKVPGELQPGSPST